MSVLSYWKVQNHIIVRLTQIWLLSNRLRLLLNQNKHKTKEKLDNLLQEDLLKETDLMKIASEEGIRTTLDYQKLRSEDPQRAERILKQSRLRSSQVLLESDVNLLEKIYPEIVWSSLSIMSLSVFESNMKIICYYLKVFLKIESDIDEMKGQSIVERSKNYIRQIPDLNYNFSTSKLWEKIRGHQTIRNLVVHNGSFLDSSKYSKAALHFIKNSDTNLKIDKESRLIIEKEYIDEIIDNLQDWLLDFFQVLKDTYPEIDEFEIRV